MQPARRNEFFAEPGGGWTALAWTGASAAVFLVFAALCVPFFRSVAWMGDEGISLDGAARMLRGDMIYRDFFEFLPPGHFLLVAGWLDAFGESFAAARVLAVLTLAGIATLTWLASAVVSRWTVLSFLLALAWLLQTQVYWPVQLNHHWFTTLLSMAALVVLLARAGRPAASWRWLVAGALLGGAAMVTPTRGAYAILACAPLLLFEDRRLPVLLRFAGGCAIFPLAALAFLVAGGAAKNAFDDVIVFTLFNYSVIQKVPFGWAEIHPRQVVFVYPLTLALSVVNVSPTKRPPVSRDACACIGFAVAGLLGCWPRPDVTHILFTLPLALPLAALNLSVIRRPRPRAIGLAITLAAALLCLRDIRWYGSLVARDSQAFAALSPRGLVVFAGDPDAPALIDAVKALPAAATVAFYPYIPLLPFLAGRPQTIPYDVFVPGYTAEAQYREACAAVASSVDYLVWDRRWSDLAVLRSAFPLIADSQGKARLEAAIRDGFDVVFERGDYQVRKRNARPRDTLCGAGA